MGVLQMGFMIPTSSLTLFISLSQIWTIHGRSIEVVQSLREFDFASGNFGEALDTVTSKFLDTDLFWTEDSCLNLPISDRNWVVDRIEYNPSNVNPEFRWFLKDIIVFPGLDCKTRYYSAAAPPIKINIENLNELSTAPAWLQERNYPYYGKTYTPTVKPGDITVEDPKKLLGRPMNAKEMAEAAWEKGKGYLEAKAKSLRDQENATQEIMSEKDRRVLEIEALREFSKLETVTYDIWPQYQFFGQASILLEWDWRVFHVSSEEEWTNQGSVKGKMPPVDGGEFVDEDSD
ncbi:hypothetical protein TWF506_010471 [Arthrobotrys conoides]|uniref:Uncharacterized protein n=1 Tax=Arthrobotrys conoides TaxID=74498 RepID=A0AAN8NB32_9PEZI